MEKKLLSWQQEKQQLLERFENERREWWTEMDEIKERVKLLLQQQRGKRPTDEDVIADLHRQIEADKKKGDSHRTENREH